jgi:myo-inositol 2-dehydrogenase/D-chiro-inositol 1-dehydrogenase
MSGPLGVGFLGAGPVTQAIHLPVIASLADRLRVIRVMDVDAGVAAEVAGRCGAAPATNITQVLDDPAVDIVAICSPHQFHADQAAAACAAGKRVVLCEKPLATTADQARLIASASAASGVPVVAGTMHAYDRGYAAARRHWGNLPDTATLVRSVIYLPANDLMVDASTELAVATPQVATGPVTAGPSAQSPGGDRSRSLPHPPTIRDAILGLAMHSIPLIREFMPQAGSVSFARMLTPWGYNVTITDNDRAIQLIGFMPGQWAPDWTLRVLGHGQELRVSFPPSYVLAGSATAELVTGRMRSSWHYPENGYQAEWEHVADVAEGLAKPAISIDEAVADLVYAIDIADQATAASAVINGEML